MKLAEDSNFQAKLMAVVRTLNAHGRTHEEMFDTARTHLSEVKAKKADGTESYYLRSCKFHLIDENRKGRSVDSPKRSNLATPLDVVIESEDAVPDALIAENPVFSA